MTSAYLFIGELKPELPVYEIELSPHLAHCRNELGLGEQTVIPC